MGGGTLAEEVGKAVWYRAPLDNKDCMGSAVIEVFCAGHLLDTVYITITTYTGRRCTGRKPYTFLVPPVAFSLVTGEIHEGEHTGSTYTKPDGTTALALESIEATYITKYYDCNQVLCATRNIPGLRRYGIAAPIDQLIQNYSDLVGKVVDFRSKKMKEQQCCPPKLIKADYEKQ